MLLTGVVNIQSKYELCQYIQLTVHFKIQYNYQKSVILIKDNGLDLQFTIKSDPEGEGEGHL